MLQSCRSCIKTTNILWIVPGTCAFQHAQSCTSGTFNNQSSCFPHLRRKRHSWNFVDVRDTRHLQPGADIFYVQMLVAIIGSRAIGEIQKEPVVVKHGNGIRTFILYIIYIYIQSAPLIHMEFTVLGGTLAICIYIYIHTLHVMYILLYIVYIYIYT